MATLKFGQLYLLSNKSHKWNNISINYTAGCNQIYLLLHIKKLHIIENGRSKQIP